MLENNQTKNKLCTKCNTIKPLVEFRKSKRLKDGFMSKCKICAKEYYSANKEVLLIKMKAYREANKEALLEQKKVYHKLNRDKLIAKSKSYYENNKDTRLEIAKIYNKNNTENKRAYDKVYRQTKIGKAVKKNSEHKRRSITRQGDVTTEQLLKLQQNAKKCYWCKCDLKNVKVHIDHMFPLSKGGEHTINNLVVSCSTCNLSKHAKDPLKFANSIGRLL